MTADQLLSGRAPTHRSNRIAALTSSSVHTWYDPSEGSLQCRGRNATRPACGSRSGPTRRCSRYGAIPAHCLMSLARSCGRCQNAPIWVNGPSPRAAAPHRLLPLLPTDLATLRCKRGLTTFRQNVVSGYLKNRERTTDKIYLECQYDRGLFVSIGIRLRANVRHPPTPTSRNPSNRVPVDNEDCVIMS